MADKRYTARDLILGLEASGGSARTGRRGVTTNKNQAAPPGRGQGAARNVPQPQQNTPSHATSSNQRVTTVTANGTNVTIETRPYPTVPSAWNLDEAASDTKRVLGATADQVSYTEVNLRQLRDLIERHSQDLLHLKNQVISKEQQSEQFKAMTNKQLAAKVQQLSDELSRLTLLVKKAIEERRQADLQQANKLAGLQERIKRSDDGALRAFKSVGDKGKAVDERVAHEAAMLNQRIEHVIEQVNGNMEHQEERIGRESEEKYAHIVRAIKTEVQARTQYEKDIKKMLDGRCLAYDAEFDSVRDGYERQRAECRDRFRRISDHLAVFEKHLQQGGFKLSGLLTTEENVRTLHEQAQLDKVAAIEEQLADHFKQMNAAVDGFKAECDQEPPPKIDLDGIIRQLESIATDKEKTSIENLLTLEERINRVQTAAKREAAAVTSRLEELPRSSTLSKWRKQLSDMQTAAAQIAKSQSALRKRLDQETPKDFRELELKLENYKKQTRNHLEREEQERYEAIQDLQKAITHTFEKQRRDLKKQGQDPTLEQFKFDISVARKNVEKLDGANAKMAKIMNNKINEEIRKRGRIPSIDDFQ